MKMTREERQKLIDSMPKPVSKYTERFYVGYRWFDTRNVKPMYAFGHGLSYVGFGYDKISAKASAKEVSVSFVLTNEGTMEADEVAQVYVHRVNSSVEWPVKELKAYKRVTLKAGESRKLTLSIPMDDLRYWDENASAWKLEKGQLQLLVGSASDDIRLKTNVNI